MVLVVFNKDIKPWFSVGALSEDEKVLLGKEWRGASKIVDIEKNMKREKRLNV